MTRLGRLPVCLGSLLLLAGAQSVSAETRPVKEFVGRVSSGKAGTSLIGADGVSYHALYDSAAEIRILSACAPNARCRISGLADEEGMLVKVTQAETVSDSRSGGPSPGAASGPAASAPAPSGPAPSGKTPSGKTSSGADQNESAPSFDCRRASSAVERMVCGSYRLSALDARMAAAYREAKQKGGARVTADQGKWIRQRNRCRNEPCLREAYEQRLRELGAASGGPHPSE